MTWTQFWDMHSGGRTKEPPYEKIYIEAPRDEAVAVFWHRFGHNPSRVTCTCCGDDYSIDEEPTLGQLSGHHRNLRALDTPRGDDKRYIQVTEANGYTPEQVTYFKEHYYLEPGEQPQYGFTADRHLTHGDPLTVDEYIARPDVLVITASEITAEERRGEVPEQGYVWVGSDEPQRP